MSFNSNKTSQDGLYLMSMENGFDRYTNNKSAFSIHNYLNQILGSNNKTPDESLFELEPQTSKRYPRDVLFKIRNESSQAIKNVAINKFKNFSFRDGLTWDPEIHFTQTNSDCLTLNDFNQIKTSTNQITRSRADQELLSLIKGGVKTENILSHFPNKKKTNVLDKFIQQNPDLLQECSMKHKIPKALTVQEIEAEQSIHSVPSIMTLQQLESMHLNESNDQMYENIDANLILTKKDEMDDCSESNLNDEDEQSVSIKNQNEKEHFNSLLQKLNFRTPNF
ncbi:unnamed protein product [Brachionus calyciflorus]|uniref:Uncharacterized protein n=1 Tax=Brachionus calyciflorus TaxID=104777 RepID=A0A813WF70_9BILA|nr:unnamed protein product [Brachionus calyciflorus]